MAYQFYESLGGEAGDGLRGVGSGEGLAQSVGFGSDTSEAVEKHGVEVAGHEEVACKVHALYQPAAVAGHGHAELARAVYSHGLPGASGTSAVNPFAGVVGERFILYGMHVVRSQRYVGA